MRLVTYSMGVSLDGYIVGPDGTFDWAPRSSTPATAWCASRLGHGGRRRASGPVHVRPAA
jgi:hypothetical protein